jgi:hypothetical protein
MTPVAIGLFADWPTAETLHAERSDVGARSARENRGE